MKGKRNRSLEYGRICHHDPRPLLPLNHLGLQSHREVALYLFILGAGAGIAFAPLNSAIMGESPESERGMTSGLLKTMTNLGSTLGITITLLAATTALGPKMAEVAAHTLKPGELARAFDTAYLFAMMIQVIALILMLGVRESEHKRSEEY